MGGIKFLIMKTTETLHDLKKRIKILLQYKSFHVPRKVDLLSVFPELLTYILSILLRELIKPSPERFDVPSCCNSLARFKSLAEN